MTQNHKKANTCFASYERMIVGLPFDEGQI